MTVHDAPSMSKDNECAAILSRFADSLLALREFVSLIEPHIEQSIKQVFDEEVLCLVPLAVALKTLDSESDFRDAFQSIPDDKLRRLFDGNIEITAPTGETHVRDVTITVTGNDAPKWHKAINRLRRNRQHTEHLYRSSLLSLATTTEWHISQLFSYFYRRFPESVATKEKAFSLGDLMAFGSIADAQEHLIASRVEDTMRGSFSDWIGVFKDKLKLSASYLDSHLDDMIEIFQRRNLVVHNGSIVNSIYLAKVSEKHRNAVRSGQKLAIDREYLDRAIDLLEVHISLLAAELWKKLEPRDESRGDLLCELAYEHMAKERWHVAQAFYFFVQNDARMKENTRLVARLNVWQCRKWAGDDIRAEVEKHDFSATDDRYVLGSLALKDDIDGAMRLAHRLVETSALTASDLREWPIFRAFRRDERWVDMVDGMSSSRKPIEPRREGLLDEVS